jgi:hypothetical protein
MVPMIFIPQEVFDKLVFVEDTFRLRNGCALTKHSADP